MSKKIGKKAKEILDKQVMSKYQLMGTFCINCQKFISYDDSWSEEHEGHAITELR